MRFDYLAINFSCGHLASISASSDFPNAQEPSLQLEASDVTVPGPVAWSPAGLGASSPRPPDGCSMHSPARRPRCLPPGGLPPGGLPPGAPPMACPPWPPTQWPPCSFMSPLSTFAHSPEATGT